MTTRRFAAAVSEHPLVAHATGEVVGQVLDRVGNRPDIAALWVTAPLIGDLDEICRAVRTALDPRVLVGASAVGVLGNQREVEQRPSLSLWAARVPEARVVRLRAGRRGDELVIEGFPSGEVDGTVVLVADPFTFPLDAFLTQLRRIAPGVAVVGGLASASAHPGGNRLVIDDAIVADGVVGFHVPDGAVTTVVSQGCRPVGNPFTVTAVADHELIELGGRPAFERLRDLVAGADQASRALMENGMHLGVVVDEQQLDFRRGDFLIRGVLGVDATTGSVTVGERLSVGQTVQFQVRDAATASEDLQELLRGRHAAGALVFTCNGRGSHLFDVPDHDASMIYEVLGAPALAGMFCAGEVGPVGGVNHVHGFTASVALFE